MPLHRGSAFAAAPVHSTTTPSRSAPRPGRSSPCAHCAVSVHVLRSGDRRSRCPCNPSRCLYAVHWLPTISAVHCRSRHTSQRFALPCPVLPADTVRMGARAPSSLTAGLDVRRFPPVLSRCGGRGALRRAVFPVPPSRILCAVLSAASSQPSLVPCLLAPARPASPATADRGAR